MLRSRSTFAVIFSIVLIFGAVFVRYTNAKEATTAQNNQILLDSKYNEFTNLNTKEGFNQALGKTSVDTQQLSSTDLIGRQMFGDYMKLISTGQATPEGINQLASKYAKNISSMDIAQKIHIEQIDVVKDSPLTLQNYSTQLTTIRNKYQKLGQEELKKIGGEKNIIKNLNQFSEGMSILYKNAIQELAKISVPESIAPYHVTLLSSYEDSYAGFIALSKFDKDPLSAYAGLDKLYSDTDKENDALQGIKMTLESKGIMTMTDI